MFFYQLHIFFCFRQKLSHKFITLKRIRSIFDDIIVTDSVEEAEAFAKETFFKKVEGEKKMYDEMKEAEKKAQEEELAAAGDAEDEDIDDEEL